jgi:hypothetical protein
MEQIPTEMERANGEDFVSRAVGMGLDEVASEIGRFRDDLLASMIRFLEWLYNGADTGFAATLHSLCILEAAERFVNQFNREGGNE